MALVTQIAKTIRRRNIWVVGPPSGCLISICKMANRRKNLKVHKGNGQDIWRDHSLLLGTDKAINWIGLRWFGEDEHGWLYRWFRCSKYFVSSTIKMANVTKHHTLTHGTHYGMICNVSCHISKHYSVTKTCKKK